ncbi:golgin-84 isoform X2 [Tribolium castaneum]|uniref:golgin-84 isoform X2 n=1 Tax=Tribolium castaneum TaxID=7070 RepID=UPI00046C1E04|nr:PREDICTED: golgin-84 isoform X2 [Tribolium castaneum]|eukprot:XP_008193631.1 PREDICTED: golgin-84 isoform X2 [Tribolium castaneum]
MAWLQNLAGRAEDLLNKIDQNAATVLNDSKLIDENIMPSDLDEKTYEETINLTGPQSDTIDSIKPTFEEELCVVEDLEKLSKGDSPGPSISSHNSFVLTEDVQSYTDTINKLEIELQDLNKQLLNLHHLYAELRNENANLRSQVEASNYLVATAQSEMEQYKARAQRILQEKDDLIRLKNENKSSQNDQILTNYHDELKKEIEFQQSRNVELSEKVKKLTHEISHLQQQMVLSQNSSQQSTQLLQENLTREQKIRLMAEDECRVKNQELQLKLQELAQQYQVIQSKSDEIAKLQDALKSKPSTDFESRIKSLTDTLMVKQNALERVTTERNALRIQLEKLETEYHNNLAQLERAQVRVINVNDTDDVKSQVPQFMRVSPFDAGVTRRVKHAYSTVDAISVRTGIFLRRYPLARVFVFCYMVLLHFWALILLFLYAPSSR